MESFSLSLPINLVEERKWLLAETSFEATNSVFNIDDENNSFSISTPGHGSPEFGEELFMMFSFNMIKCFMVKSFNMMLKSFLPNKVKINFTIDVIRLKSKLTLHKTIRYTKKSLSYTIRGFPQPQSGPLSDIERFVQLIPVPYESEKPINITDINKIHLNCDCVNKFVVNGTREPTLNSSALDQLQGKK